MKNLKDSSDKVMVSIVNYATKFFCKISGCSEGN